MLQTLGQTLKISKNKCNGYVRRGEKIESYQIIKTKKERNRRKRKDKYKDQKALINMADIN